jgi:hypothetical protein
LHDYVLLQSLCETLDRKNQAEKDLRDHKSLTFENRHGELKPHPAVQIIRDFSSSLLRYPNVDDDPSVTMRITPGGFSSVNSLPRNPRLFMTTENASPVLGL